MAYAISLSGLQNAQTDLNVIGNNIANANTNGFKGSTVEFSNLVAGSAYSNPKDIVGIGSAVNGSTTLLNFQPIIGGSVHA